ncbi:phosphotransferase family protein [Actinocorallia longicatena]|uniref:Phosphotransferase family protein n=1 Tax=Actinocorallia longicatena TaxID=111803 RepID=A0ABP6QB26_9ACTN
MERELAAVYGPDVKIEGLSRDSGGASRLTSAFDAVTAAGRVPLILRQTTPGAEVVTSPLAREAALMRAARTAGVPVPEIVAEGEDFIVMERVEGETIPRRILRAPELAQARERLAGECGTILAALHTIPPATIADLPEEDELARWSGVLAELGEPHPVLELAFRRLELARPAPERTVVVHGDFRNGNLIVGPDGVRAVLDWELSHLGDPLEDLGWLCAKAWRFGSASPVGGFGPYEQLVEAYERASGTTIDLEALRWWETFAGLKWAVICVMQARRHLSGGERSVELAALGRRVAENEWDLLHSLP